jgi:peptide deformylase
MLSADWEEQRISARSAGLVMAKLDILHFPDPRLRTKASPVAKVDNRARAIIRDMFETMYAAPGIGLAATQVNIHEQIIVLDISPTRNAPMCFVNPIISDRQGEEEMEEGCLSVPGVYDTVRRAERVRVRAQDSEGREFDLEVDGLLAVCIQHEMDHLSGRLFVDYLSPLKRERLRKRALKELRQDGVTASPIGALI